jgi:hypothetical protein
MSQRFQTGNSATLTLSGTLTTGVTTAWVGDIVSINPGSWELGERDVTVLSDTGFQRMDPADLATPNEISGTIFFRPTLGIPSLAGSVSTARSLFRKCRRLQAASLALRLRGRRFSKRFSFRRLKTTAPCRRSLRFA